MPVVWSSPCAVSFTSQLNVAAATQHGLPLQRSYSSRAGNVAFQKLRIKASAELAEPRRRIACAERLHEKASSSRPLLNAKSEEGLFQILRKEVEAKNLSSSVIAALEELYRNYYNAVAESGISNAKEIAVSNMATAFDRMLIQFEDPFTFSSYHRAIREPFDYYLFGQNYIRPLIDFRNSYVGNLAVFNKIESQLRQGENIVLTSNHQTEADPAVISLLLEKTHPFIAENIIYVAGDRVIHDPVCKPFSMGRNLLCVYSKKHINDDPELAEKKKKANTRTLKEMTLLLRKGGQIIWIAPSGGRDRPNPDTKDWLPDPFDDTAVDNMRRLMEYSGVPGHMHPLSLLCYEVMPPPLKVEKEIGEKRRIGYHGVGISVAPEMKFSNFSTACDDSNKVLLTNALDKTLPTLPRFDPFPVQNASSYAPGSATQRRIFQIHYMKWYFFITKFFKKPFTVAKECPLPILLLAFPNHGNFLHPFQYRMSYERISPTQLIYTEYTLIFRQVT